MIQARLALPDGRILILLGLSDGNLARLKDDQPLRVDPAVLLSLQPGEVVGGIVIVYGKTEGDILRKLEDDGLIGPKTLVRSIPKGSTTPT